MPVWFLVSLGVMFASSCLIAYWFGASSTERFVLSFSDEQNDLFVNASLIAAAAITWCYLVPMILWLLGAWLTPVRVMFWAKYIGLVIMFGLFYAPFLVLKGQLTLRAERFAELKSYSVQAWQKKKDFFCWLRATNSVWPELLQDLRNDFERRNVRNMAVLMAILLFSPGLLLLIQIGHSADKRTARKVLGNV